MKKNKPQSSPAISMRSRQSTSHLIMVRPARFGYNEQTATSNAFQQVPHVDAGQAIQQQAREEFDTFVKILREAGVQVSVFEGTEEPHTPDALFPNNWISSHTNGKVILYPLHAPNRRLERRSDIIHFLLNQYQDPSLIDLSGTEAENRFLEGTGSMIMDRVNQRVYACVSPRTDPELFAEFCRRIDLHGVLFHAVDAQGQAIYHTNVMMALGSRLAVVCMDAIQDEYEQITLLSSLESTGHEIVRLSLKQVEQFAGNMLEVYNEQGESFWVMSRRAMEALDPTQREILSQDAEILVIPLDVIETYGGGSVRCMMAEVFV